MVNTTAFLIQKSVAKKRITRIIYTAQRVVLM